MIENLRSRLASWIMVLKISDGESRNPISSNSIKINFQMQELKVFRFENSWKKVK
jgi:hypothetical protein